MFTPYIGDNIGLTADENHLVFRWDGKDCKILFSICKRGDSAGCHFASDKRGLRHLREACNDFFDFVMSEFAWCERIMLAITRKSVCKLMESVGFELLGKADDSFLYMRAR